MTLRLSSLLGMIAWIAICISQAHGQEIIDLNRQFNIPYNGFHVDNDTAVVTTDNLDQFHFSDPMGALLSVNRIHFNHEDISGKEEEMLPGKEDPWFENYGCVDSDVKRSELVCRLDLGESYELGEDNWFEVQVKVRIQAMNIVFNQNLGTLDTVSLGNYQRQFNVANATPEQVFYLDMRQFHFWADYYLVSVTDYQLQTENASVESAVINNLRMQAYLTREYTIDAQGEQVTNLNEQVLEGDHRVRLSWSHLCARFPNHEVQVLRLQNNDPALNGVEQIRAEFDWQNALRLEVPYYQTHVDLVLAEGTGFYAWRIRPIGDRFPSGSANFKNWGEWNASALEGSQQLNGANLPEGVLYFEAPDSNRFRTFNRTFTEGGKHHEAYTLANGLGNITLEQVRNHATGKTLNTAKLYDYSARNALQSLPVPLAGDIGDPGSLLEDDEANPLGPRHFDQLVFSIDSVQGPASTYYSSDNPDPAIPSAEGVPFSRTVFHNDGQNFPRQLGLPGETLELKPFESSHNALTYYTQATEKELVRVFGNEAPAADKVLKKVDVSPNKVVSITYQNHKGKVLATCLSKASNDTVLIRDSAAHPLGVTGLDGGMQAEVYTQHLPALRGAFNTMAFELDDPKAVTLNYELTRSFFEANCDNYCATCDYRVTLTLNGQDRNMDPILFSGNDTVLTLLDTVLLPDVHHGTLCEESSIALLSDIMLPELLPGSYHVNVNISPAAADDTWINEHLDAIHTQVLDTIESLLENDLIPGNGKQESVLYYLEQANGGEGDLDSLNAYLDSALALEAPGLSYLAEAEIYVLVIDDCKRIEVPRLQCFHPCDNPAYTATQHLYDRLVTYSGDLHGVMNNDFPPDEPLRIMFNDLYTIERFNTFFSNVIADVGCDRAWLALEATMELFIARRTGPQAASDDFNYLAYFVDQLHYQGWKGVSTLKFGQDHGYLSHAHEYMYFPGTLIDAQGNTTNENLDSQLAMDTLYPNTSLGLINGVVPYDRNLDGEITGTELLLDSFLLAQPNWTINQWNNQWDTAEWVSFRQHLSGRGLPDIVISLDTLIHMRDTLRDICQVIVHGKSIEMLRRYWNDPQADPDEFYCAVGRAIDSLATICDNLQLVDSLGVPVDLNLNNALELIAGIGTASDHTFLQNLIIAQPEIAPSNSPFCAFDFPDLVEGVYDPVTLSADLLLPSLEAKVAQVLANGNTLDWNIDQALVEIGWNDLVRPGGISCEADIPIMPNGEYWFEMDATDSCRLWLMARLQTAPLGDWSPTGGQDEYRHLVCDDLCFIPDPDVCPGFCIVWDTLFPATPPTEVVHELDCWGINRRVITQRLDVQTGRLALAAKAEAKARYKEKCRENIKQSLEQSHEELYYYYTLYYYDRAGRLVQTVAPKGVDILEVDEAQLEQPRNFQVNHNFMTQYAYNSLGQVVSATTPDGGVKRYIYDDLHRIRFTQTAAQEEEDSYSYVKYDALNRPVESGKGFSNDFDGLQAQANTVDFPSTGMEQELRLTHYSTSSGVQYEGSGQRFLQNRVSYAEAIDPQGDTNKTSYSYDPHGNVEWIVQELPGLAPKTMAYTYDLVSGLVKETSYNHGENDAFYHRYSYDAENRITSVETSTNQRVWDRDQLVEYFDHGPVKRKVTGEDQVQGTDYAHTLTGQLKAINHPSLDAQTDPAGDGTLNSHVAADAFGMMLQYFEGDFVHEGSALDAQYPDNFSTNYSLHDGNISAISMSSESINGGPASLNGQTSWQYRYDEINRLVQGTLHTESNGNWTPTDEFQSAFGYDLNGNITRLKRNAYRPTPQDSPEMDNLSYHYSIDKNQLDYVADGANPAADFNDLDDQQAGNYTYNASGQMEEDEAEGITKIEWTKSGKVQEVTKSNGYVITFTYNAMDQRTSKTVSNPFFDPVTTYYVRGASGAVEAIYEKHTSSWAESTTLKEQPIHPSDRIGVYRPDVVVASRNPFIYSACDILRRNVRFELPLESSEQIYTREVGKKHYELIDHLGNVRLVLSDLKLSTIDGMGVLSDFRIDMTSAQGYYPFGMALPGSIVNPTEYRYGFNSQEKVDEIGGNNNYNIAPFWMYSSRTSQRWNMDPKPNSSMSPYSVFAGNPIMYSDPLGDTLALFQPSGSFWKFEDDGEEEWSGRYYRRKNTQASTTSNGNPFAGPLDFRFADPVNDVKSIKDGTITMVVLVNETKIGDMLGNAGAMDEANRANKWSYIWTESHGALDFSYSTIPVQFKGASNDPLATPSPMLFIPTGDEGRGFHYYLAHNHMNFGNFLWGAAGYSLGFTSQLLLDAAHANSLFNADKNGYKGQFDSADDQLSIFKGTRYAGDKDFRDMIWSPTNGLRPKGRQP